MLTLPATTQEYIDIPLTAWAGVTDPTTLPAEVAFIWRAGEPEAADYKPGTWVTDGAGTHKVQILWHDAVPTPMAHTTYAVWLRITSTPEVPVILAGYIRTL